jgi:hypothetical protein
VAIFHAREVAAQQPSLLFDVALRQAFLKPVSANRGANLHGESSSLMAAEVYWFGSNQKMNDLIVNMHLRRLQEHSDLN